MNCIMLAMSIFGAAVLHLAAAGFTQQFQEPESACQPGEMPLDEAECKAFAKSDDSTITQGGRCGSSTEGDDSSFTDLCSLNPSTVSKQESEIQCASFPSGCLRFTQNGKQCVTYKPASFPAPSDGDLSRLAEQNFNNEAQPVPCDAGSLPATLEECKQFALTEEANKAPEGYAGPLCNSEFRTEGEASAFSDACGGGSQTPYSWCHYVQKGCVRYIYSGQFGLCVYWNAGGDGSDGRSHTQISNICKTEVLQFDAVCQTVTTTSKKTTTTAPIRATTFPIFTTTKTTTTKTDTTTELYTTTGTTIIEEKENNIEIGTTTGSAVTENNIPFSPTPLSPPPSPPPPSPPPSPPLVTTTVTTTTETDTTTMITTGTAVTEENNIEIVGTTEKAVTKENNIEIVTTTATTTTETVTTTKIVTTTGTTTTKTTTTKTTTTKTVVTTTLTTTKTTTTKTTTTKTDTTTLTTTKIVTTTGTSLTRKPFSEEVPEPAPPPCPPVKLCLSNVDMTATMAKCDHENPCQKFVRNGFVLESKCDINQCLTVQPSPMKSNRACHEVFFMPCKAAAAHQAWRKLPHFTKGGNAWMNPETGAAFSSATMESGPVVACKDSNANLASFVTAFGRHTHL